MKYLLTVLLLLSSLKMQAQSNMQAWEDSLSKLSHIVMNALVVEDRVQANFKFIPTLVHALKEKDSFTFPFSGVKTLSVLYPQDMAFRIITWQLDFKTDTGIYEEYRYFGVIQMNSEELEIYPLFDRSDSLRHPIDSVFTAYNWFGAVYYNIIDCPVKPDKARGMNVKKCYTLFGYDGNDFMSNKKIVDVLWFENDSPRFGLPVFRYYNDTTETEKFHSRVVIEYKNNADATLNYTTDHNMIIYDHLVPPNELAEGIYFLYVPDGTYEGFVWKKKKYWDYVSKVFDFAINEMDNPPVPVPIEGMEGARDQ